MTAPRPANAVSTPSPPHALRNFDHTGSWAPKYKCALSRTSGPQRRQHKRAQASDTFHGTCTIDHAQQAATLRPTHAHHSSQHLRHQEQLARQPSAHTVHAHAEDHTLGNSPIADKLFTFASTHADAVPRMPHRLAQQLFVPTPVRPELAGHRAQIRPHSKIHFKPSPNCSRHRSSDRGSSRNNSPTAPTSASLAHRHTRHSLRWVLPPWCASLHLHFRHLFRRAIAVMQGCRHLHLYRPQIHEQRGYVSAVATTRRSHQQPEALSPVRVVPTKGSKLHNKRSKHLFET